MYFPPGIRAILALRGGRNFSVDSYRISILILTYVCYASFHATRKVPSVVKSVFDPAHHGSNSSTHLNSTLLSSDLLSHSLSNSFGLSSESPNPNGWPPFNGPDGKGLLAGLDFCFLSTYAVGLFFTGHLADMCDLRLFLAAGTLLSALLAGIYGAAFFLQIHNIYFYYIVMALTGLAQSTGFPTVVAVVGYWFGPDRRGFVMGAWSTNMTLGNVVGTVVASALLPLGWGWSFLVLACFMILISLILLLFLAPEPQAVGYGSKHHTGLSRADSIVDRAVLRAGYQALEDGEVGEHNEDESALPQGDEEPFVEGLNPSDETKAIGVMQAVCIPGVIPFSICFFFIKLVGYTFLYWLPFYINSTEIGGVKLSPAEAGNLSTFFDVGGCVGGMLVGYIADLFHSKARVSAFFILLSLPLLVLYFNLGDRSYELNVAVLLVLGVVANGPYMLINAAVAADLGQHPSIQGSAHALATVTSLIDGFGSVGAIIGPLITGLITQNFDSWDGVFYMIYASVALAVVALIPPMLHEMNESRVS